MGWTHRTAIEALEQKYRQARAEGASWAEDEDGHRPAFQVGALVAQAIGEGAGWRAGRALAAFGRLLGPAFLRRSSRWCAAELRRIDLEQAARARRPCLAKARPAGGATLAA